NRITEGLKKVEVDVPGATEAMDETARQAVAGVGVQPQALDGDTLLIAAATYRTMPAEGQAMLRGVGSRWGTAMNTAAGPARDAAIAALQEDQFTQLVLKYTAAVHREPMTLQDLGLMAGAIDKAFP